MMSVAKRLIEEQLEENARQEHEFVDGAFYWVRLMTSRRWYVAQYDAEERRFWPCRRNSMLISGIAEIGPCLGKGPAPEAPFILQQAVGYTMDAIEKVPLRTAVEIGEFAIGLLRNLVAQARPWEPVPAKPPEPRS